LIIDLAHDAVIGSWVQSVTGPVTGPVLDMANGTAALNAIFATGPGTTPNAQLQIEESADGLTNWTAIPGLVFPAVTTANQQVAQMGLRQKRYVRPNFPAASGTTAGSVLLISQKHQVPGAGGDGGYDTYPAPAQGSAPVGLMDASAPPTQEQIDKAAKEEKAHKVGEGEKKAHSGHHAHAEK